MRREVVNADYRGGKPDRGVLIGGKRRKHAFAGIQRGGGRIILASSEFDCGGGEIRLRPARVRRGMRENSPVRAGLLRGSMISLMARASMTMVAASCQLLARGVLHRSGEHAVPLTPPGSPPVQIGHPVRVLALQLQLQHLREQRVVAIPPAPGRRTTCSRAPPQAEPRRLARCRSVHWPLQH